jgi:hypothetical protein
MPSTPISAGREPVDFAGVCVRYIQCLIRPDRKVVTRRAVPWQVPADLRRARGEVEASQSGGSPHWSAVLHRSQLTRPQRIAGGIRQHPEENVPGPSTLASINFSAAEEPECTL